MALYSRKGPQPLSQDQYEAHLIERAKERQRRGMVTFTRPEQRERLLGKVPESTMGKLARESQIDRRQKRRR